MNVGSPNKLAYYYYLLVMEVLALDCLTSPNSTRPGKHTVTTKNFHNA